MTAKLTWVPMAVGLVIWAAAGCAHEQKKPASPVAEASTPKPPPRVPASKKVDEQPVPQREDATAQKNEDAIYFDFENALLKDEARSTLQQVGQQLKSSSSAKLEIDGNCDERGTTEYNLALGDARALAAKEYLKNLGVSPKRIKTVSYGKERPKVDGHDESAWSKNRRDDLVVR